MLLPCVAYAVVLTGSPRLSAVDAAQASAPQTPPAQTTPAQTTPAPAAPTQTTPATTTPGASTTAATLQRPQDVREQARSEAELALKRTMIPEPIDRARFDAMLKAVDPTLAANKDLVANYDAYRAVYTRLAEDPGRRIGQLLPAAYDFDGARGTFEPRATPELVEALALRARAARFADDAEKTLFRAIMLATPLDRRHLLAFERLAELEARLPRGGLLESTSLAMRDLLARARLSEGSQVAIAPLLIAYADSSTTLFVERAKVLREGDATRATIETEAGPLWRFGDPERVTKTEERLAAVDDLEFASELAIRDAHLALLRRLRLALPRTEGRRLIEEWQRATHPELFDDERILAKLVESVVALPELAPDTDAAVLDTLDATYVRLEPLSDAASRAADRILPRLVERSTIAALDEVLARIELLDIQHKRRALVRDAISRIRALAGTAQPETLARFADLAATVAALDRADHFERDGLAALSAEIASRVDTEVPASAAGEEGTPTIKPEAGSAVPRTTPAAPVDGSAKNGANRGRGGRGSRSPIND
ncbi:MAG: hypothetical protein ACKO3W_13550 [bacterium]